MTDIDYDALAKAAYEAASPSACSCGDFDFDLSARAVVAALRDQGLCVVEREVLRGLVDAADIPRPVFPPYIDKAKAALAAPGDGETI
jgi:hypothetical protein